MDKVDVVTCGELLIDFVALEAGVALADARRFERVPGGAPANVAVGLTRFGRTAAFLGQVGDDDFGHLLSATLRVERVNTDRLRFSQDARTSLAFVSLLADGERDFMFYRHPSADMLWKANGDDLTLAANCRVFHHGSISLISDPSRTSTLAAIDAARNNGALISFDPNLRLSLWPSTEIARRVVDEAMQRADLVKLSDEELDILTRCGDDYQQGAQEVWRDSLRLLVVTVGAHGCYWMTGAESGFSSGFSVTPLDTTGAGDAFMAGLLSGLLEQNLSIEADTLSDIMRLANAAGALTVTHRGAIPALPTRAQLDEFLALQETT